jgi:hypothetical protein
MSQFFTEDQHIEERMLRLATTVAENRHGIRVGNTIQIIIHSQAVHEENAASGKIAIFEPTSFPVTISKITSELYYDSIRLIMEFEGFNTLRCDKITQNDEEFKRGVEIPINSIKYTFDKYELTESAKLYLWTIPDDQDESEIYVVDFSIM